MLEKNRFNVFNNQRHLHLKYKFSVLFIVLLGSLLIFQCSLKSKESPTTNNGIKWRIGYYEGGPWNNYQGYFLGIIDGLTELGWMEEIPLPELPDDSDTRILWEYLSKNTLISSVFELIESSVDVVISNEPE